MCRACATAAFPTIRGWAHRPRWIGCRTCITGSSSGSPKRARQPERPDSDDISGRLRRRCSGQGGRKVNCAGTVSVTMPAGLGWRFPSDTSTVERMNSFTASHEDGILRLHWRPGVFVTYEIAVQAARTLEELSGGQALPILVDITGVTGLS